MGRTRSALVDGAARAVEKYGSRRATMSDIAALSGVAKATLYNHFRTKTDIYLAAVETLVSDLAAESEARAGEDLTDALAQAAERLAADGALARVAADEPQVAALLLRPLPGGLWDRAREAVGATLRASGRADSAGSRETVLRWLVTFAGAGAVPDARAGAAVLAAGLPAISAPAVTAPAEPPRAADAWAGLGWPT